MDSYNKRNSKMTQKFVKEQEDILLGFIPPYSPELNPDELVWNHLKLRLGKIAIFSKEEMKSGVLSIMRSMQKKKDLIQSFFRLKDTKYILEAVSV